MNQKITRIRCRIRVSVLVSDYTTGVRCTVLRLLLERQDRHCTRRRLPQAYHGDVTGVVVKSQLGLCTALIGRILPGPWQTRHCSLVASAVPAVRGTAAPRGA